LTAAKAAAKAAATASNRSNNSGSNSSNNCKSNRAAKWCQRSNTAAVSAAKTVAIATTTAAKEPKSHDDRQDNLSVADDGLNGELCDFCTRGAIFLGATDMCVLGVLHMVVLCF
jgi:hypothetical protein